MKLTHGQSLDLVRLYLDGWGSKALAARFGICCQTVLNAVRRHGLTPRSVGRHYA